MISDAEIAEISYTAFTSRRKSEHIDGRLIVGSVKRLNPASVKTKAKTKTKASEAGAIIAVRRPARPYSHAS